MRLLVIDDSPVLRAVFANLVRSLGHELAGEAADLLSGLAAAAAAGPDAVVVDGRICAEGVGAAVAELRAAAPRAAIYIVAALSETGTVRAAMTAGATGALLRPYSSRSVAAAFPPP